MLKFKVWLESIRNSNINRLVIMDFDGTLANTPAKPDSEQGKKLGWNGKDWFGSEVSLPEDVSLNDEVLEAFKQAKSDPRTYVALITGRRDVVAHGVRKILQKNNLIGRRVIPKSAKTPIIKDLPHPKENDVDAHDEYYSGDFKHEPEYPVYKNKPAGDTLSHKIFTIKKLMNDNIEILEMWEDRAEHIPSFINLFLEFQKIYPNLKQVMLHQVYPEKNGYVQHIPIKHGMVY